jgi:transposase-like protein
VAGLRGPRIAGVAGPLRAASMTSLPPADTRRWVVRRKAAVVAAVQSGKITLEEACRRYNLSEEEFRAWQRAFEAHGLPGLRATRLQQYRTSPSRPRRR